MKMSEKLQLLELLRQFKAHIDEDPPLDQLDVDILKVCMEAPAGYEDLLCN